MLPGLRLHRGKHLSVCTYLPLGDIFLVVLGQNIDQNLVFSPSQHPQNTQGAVGRSSHTPLTVEGPLPGARWGQQGGTPRLLLYSGPF